MRNPRQARERFLQPQPMPGLKEAAKQKLTNDQTQAYSNTPKATKKPTADELDPATRLQFNRHSQALRQKLEAVDKANGNFAKKVGDVKTPFLALGLLLYALIKRGLDKAKSEDLKKIFTNAKNDLKKQNHERNKLLTERSQLQNEQKNLKPGTPEYIEKQDKINGLTREISQINDQSRQTLENLEARIKPSQSSSLENKEDNYAEAEENEKESEEESEEKEAGIEAEEEEESEEAGVEAEELEEEEAGAEAEISEKEEEDISENLENAAERGHEVRAETPQPGPSPTPGGMGAAGG
jgi:hypothetical protein